MLEAEIFKSLIFIDPWRNSQLFPEIFDPEFYFQLEFRQYKSLNIGLNIYVYALQ